jgi:hypothetical protein
LPKTEAAAGVTTCVRRTEATDAAGRATRRPC